MPPRLRTRSATKNPDATLTTDDKPVSKAATVNKKRGKVAASDPSETVSVKKTPRSRKKTELVEGKVEQLAKPLTVKGSSSARRRLIAEESDEDEHASSDDASADRDDVVADLDIADSDNDSSPGVNLLDLEAEDDEDANPTELQDVAVLDVGEDLDAYESSFIDDSGLQDDSDAAETDIANVAHSGEEDMSSRDGDSSGMELDDDDDDDVPLARPSGKSPSAKRHTIVSDDDGSPTKKMRKYKDHDTSNHPFNRGSDLHDTWFGASAFLADTKRMNDWNNWRRRQIMNNRKMQDVSGTNLEAALMLQYNDFNFILDNNLLPTYTSWVADSMAKRRKDPEWMAKFSDWSDGDNDESQASKLSPTKSSKSSASVNKRKTSADQSAKSPSTPKKDGKGKSTDRSSRKIPSTPQTPSTALVSKLTDLRILRDECRQWYNTVMATETEAPIMPNVILDDLQPPSFALLPGSGTSLTSTKFAEEVLRNDEFPMSEKARLKLATLVCTATFGPWLYNLAIVPFKALTTSTGPSSSAGSLELHRVILKPTKTHHLVAGVMFGLAAAESTLIKPMLTKGDTRLLSKSLTLWPINEHFSRVMSLANKFFNESPLKLSLYQKGLTFRARMVTPNGTSTRGTRFVPLQGQAAPKVDINSMPHYLTKTQLNSVDDDVPIYDATAFFTGKKTAHKFSLGEHDIQCPRLTREIRTGEFIAIVHSLSTYPSNSHGGSVLAFNVYYAVLLASPN